MHTIKQPVTLGSRVPECPVLLTFNILRNQATTSCEEGFEGLSRFITPELHGEEPRVVKHERGSTLEERAGIGRQSVLTEHKFGYPASKGYTPAVLE